MHKIYLTILLNNFNVLKELTTILTDVEAINNLSRFLDKVHQDIKSIIENKGGKLVLWLNDKLHIHFNGENLDQLLETSKETVKEIENYVHKQCEFVSAHSGLGNDLQESSLAAIANMLPIFEKKKPVTAYSLDIEQLLINFAYLKNKSVQLDTGDSIQKTQEQIESDEKHTIVNDLKELIEENNHKDELRLKQSETEKVAEEQNLEHKEEETHSEPSLEESQEHKLQDMEEKVAEQLEKPNEDQKAQYDLQLEELTQQIKNYLSIFKDKQPLLEELKTSDPELYQALLGILDNLIDTVKQLKVHYND